jgi:hypothetical protein
VGVKNMLTLIILSIVKRILNETLESSVTKIHLEAKDLGKVHHFSVGLL